MRIRPPVVAASLGLVACAGLVAAAPAATAAQAGQGSLNVWPASNLQPGASIQFAGSGFPPGLALQLEECDQPPGGRDPARCTPIAGTLFLTAPDGTVRGAATVVAGPVGTQPGASCPASRQEAGQGGQCLLTLQTPDPSGWAAATPLRFAASVPVPDRPAPTASTPAPAPSPAAPPARYPAGGAAIHRPPPRTVSPRIPWSLGLACMVAAALVAGAIQARRAQRRRRRSPGLL